MYGTPANRAESQELEAWPASIHRHLRKGYLSVWDKIFSCLFSSFLLLFSQKGFAYEYHAILSNKKIRFSQKLTSPPKLSFMGGQQAECVHIGKWAPPSAHAYFIICSQLKRCNNKALVIWLLIYFGPSILQAVFRPLDQDLLSHMIKYDTIWIRYKNIQTIFNYMGKT